MKRSGKSATDGALSLPEAPERRALSRKELAREQRHAMYQRAKELRATDPRYLAMKEAARERQRAMYQRVKTQREAVAATQKAQRGAERAEQQSRQRAQSDRVLSMLVTWPAKGSTAQN